MTASVQGITQIARETGLGRESLYKALSPEGNPEFATVLRRRHELTIAKYVLEKWCNSILHGMNHAVFGYRPFLYQTL